MNESSALPSPNGLSLSPLLGVILAMGERSVDEAGESKKGSAATCNNLGNLG